MLAITLGDPKSINVRAILHLLNETPWDTAILLIGSWRVWQSQSESMASIPIKGESPSMAPHITLIESVDEIEFKKPGIYFFDPMSKPG